MRRMVGARDGWAGISKQFRLIQKKPICTDNKSTTTSNGSTDKVDGSLSTYKEAYRQLDKLDFMTAAKILFNSPPKEKKFGIDFHLVQFFFACMPSLAVYLVAQYARYEMRRMEAEMELKRQAEEEAKENELNASEEKEAGSNPELLEVKARLDKLEEALKEIVVESKKQPDRTSNKNQEDSSEKRGDAASIHNHPQNGSEASNSTGKDRHRSVHNHPQSRPEASNSTPKSHHSK